MNIFVIIAGMVVLFLLAAAWQRPRPGVIVAAILWLAYTVYEYQVASGVLCDPDCNIRVDLVFIFPILGLATYCAYRSYEGLPSQLKVVGIVLGVIGLFVCGLVAESYGHGDLAFAVVVIALTIGLIYAIKSRSVTNRP